MGVACGARGGMGVSCGAHNIYSMPFGQATGAALTAQQEAHEQYYDGNVTAATDNGWILTMATSQLLASARPCLPVRLPPDPNCW
eukprot:2966456-Rhodomonas_salina.1